MTACPPPDRLRHLLDDELSAADQRALQTHLESCPECQQALERLAAAGPSWDRAARLLASLDEPTGPALQEVVEQLEATAFTSTPPAPLAGAETQAEPRPGAVDEFAFLEPPTEPGQLGRLGHYAILEVVGRGGMGIVFKAPTNGCTRIVAVKVLGPQYAASGSAQALPARGEGRRRRQPRPRRADLPRRGSARHFLPRHAVDPRQIAAGTDRPGRHARVEGNPPHRLPDRQRFGGRPQARVGASRHQAGEHPAGERRRARQDHRLRPGPRGGRRHRHAVGRHHRHADVHVARASARRGRGRRAQRSVQPRQCGVHDGHRPGAVPRHRHARRHPPRHQRHAAADAREQPGCPRLAGVDRRQVARQGSRGPFSERRRGCRPARPASRPFAGATARAASGAG